MLSWLVRVMSDAADKKVKGAGGASRTSGRKQVFRTDKGANVSVERGAKTPRGTEVWHVRVNGKIVSLTTSNSSASIMDDAVKIYSPALERLAKR
jgi:hypothetical protein